eukprot:TRINITY_DN7240_c0_g2_i1.p1 TRINITY_DN7240_c0_g2~~TRINITY_DN7240_c0_g2_i1.p1  ORF type:complete len:571 (-),score=56.88 TRINITY_DN7240_c0_g2_i1:60-1772(-)
MVNCIVRTLASPHTGALVMLVAIACTTFLQVKYTLMALEQTNTVLGGLGQKGLPSTPRSLWESPRSDNFVSLLEPRMLRGADTGGGQISGDEDGGHKQSAKASEAVYLDGRRANSSETRQTILPSQQTTSDSLERDKGNRAQTARHGNDAIVLANESTKVITDAVGESRYRRSSHNDTAPGLMNETQTSDKLAKAKETGEEDVEPAWKRDHSVLIVVAFYCVKAYVAIFLSIASVFFMLTHDLAQYIGQLRLGHASRGAHQGAGCLCGAQCGLAWEERLQSWKVSVGRFHAVWNTAIGIVSFLLIHALCEDGKNCFGIGSVAQVAIATGLLKSVENILHETRIGLKKVLVDVRQAARRVDTHPKYVVSKSKDGVHVSHKILSSVVTDEHAKRYSIIALLATAENGFSAAFHTMGYCDEKIMKPFLEKLEHSLKADFRHFENLAKETFDQATSMFTFVRTQIKAIEGAMHGLAKKNAHPSQHASILATIKEDLERLDGMVKTLLDLITKYADKVLHAPKEGIDMLMDELEKLEDAALHEFDRLFPEERNSSEAQVELTSRAREEDDRHHSN